jgi:hypothetical protein
MLPAEESLLNNVILPEKILFQVSALLLIILGHFVSVQRELRFSGLVHIPLRV